MRGIIRLRPGTYALFLLSFLLMRGESIWAADLQGSGEKARSKISCLSKNRDVSDSYLEDIAKLSARPVYSQAVYEGLVESRVKSLPGRLSDIQRSDTQCPQSNALIKKIFSRIVTRAHLETFVSEQKLTINCDCSKFGLFGGSPTINRSQTGIHDGGMIVIAGVLVSKAYSEDELAFAIAHEIGHELMGHPEEMELPVGERPRRPTSLSREFEADEVGLKLLTIAGYNVRSAVTSFKKIREEVHECLGNLCLPASMSDGFFVERQSAIENMIKREKIRSCARRHDDSLEKSQQELPTVKELQAIRDRNRAAPSSSASKGVQ